MNNDDSNKILYANFNQDGSCFSVGTENGFKIYNSNPFRDNFERNLEGGIGIVEMLYKTNILALVGGGKQSKYPDNKVIIWDDNQGKVVSELRFSSSVKNIKLKKETLIVVTEHKYYLFALSTFKNTDTIDTCENPNGIIAVCNNPNTTIIAYPDKKQGHVRVKFYNENTTQTIEAHESGFAFLALNSEGTMLATASDKGTLIRIYNTKNGEALQEVRRGSEKATIYSIAFNLENSMLAVSSDRGTIHIFTLSTALKKLKDGQK